MSIMPHFFIPTEFKRGIFNLNYCSYPITMDFMKKVSLMNKFSSFIPGLTHDSRFLLL